MAKFETLPVREALVKSATGKRGAILNEYIGYIQSLEPEQAGKLAASPGETLGAVRRRIGAAAKQLGMSVVIKRTDDHVYFWADEGVGKRRTRRSNRSR